MYVLLHDFFESWTVVAVFNVKQFVRILYNQTGMTAHISIRIFSVPVPCASAPVMVHDTTAIGLKVTIQAQRNREELILAKKQSTIDTFYSFTDSITTQTEKSRPDG